MKSYKHKTGTIIGGYNSHKEHCFYEDTTKRQMFLIIEQLATQLKMSDQTWEQKALEELHLLKLNGIK